jgi:hypothetical protein
MLRARGAWAGFLGGLIGGKVTLVGFGRRGVPGLLGPSKQRGLDC